MNDVHRKKLTFIQEPMEMMRGEQVALTQRREERL